MVADVVGAALACVVAVAAIEGVVTTLDTGAVVGVAEGVVVVHPLTAITIANKTRIIPIEIGLKFKIKSPINYSAIDYYTI